MIRQIEPDEAALLVPLNNIVQGMHAKNRPDLFHGNPDPEATRGYFASWLEADGVVALVSFHNGGPRGYAIFERQVKPGCVLSRPETRGFLHHIAVMPAARRKGVALALIDEGAKRLRAQGCTRLMSSFHAFNTASRRLMTRAGMDSAVVYCERAL